MQCQVWNLNTCGVTRALRKLWALRKITETQPTATSPVSPDSASPPQFLTETLDFLFFHLYLNIISDVGEISLFSVLQFINCAES